MNLPMNVEPFLPVFQHLIIFPPQMCLTRLKKKIHPSSFSMQIEILVSEGSSYPSDYHSGILHPKYGHLDVMNKEWLF